jgi:hypothetical protein
MLPDQYELFEIKTQLAPRDCVREAFGQLLEYAYWPGSPNFNALWIVGPSPIDNETQEYLDGLRERFGIPVDYGINLLRHLRLNHRLLSNHTTSKKASAWSRSRALRLTAARARPRSRTPTAAGGIIPALCDKASH